MYQESKSLPVECVPCAVGCVGVLMREILQDAYDGKEEHIQLFYS